MVENIVRKRLIGTGDTDSSNERTSNCGGNCKFYICNIHSQSMKGAF